MMLQEDISEKADGIETVPENIITLTLTPEKQKTRTNIILKNLIVLVMLLAES